MSRHAGDPRRRTGGTRWAWEDTWPGDGGPEEKDSGWSEEDCGTSNENSRTSQIAENTHGMPSVIAGCRARGGARKPCADARRDGPVRIAPRRLPAAER